MNSIFPFIEVDDDIEVEEAQIPMAREYAFDFDKKDFKRRNGKMYLVEANEAIKIWIWKLLKIERFKELIYSWDYGHEFVELIGKGYTPDYTDAEIKRYIEEAIEYNLDGYIETIDSIEVELIGSELYMDIMITTIYGEVQYIE